MVLVWASAFAAIILSYVAVAQTTAPTPIITSDGFTVYPIQYGERYYSSISPDVPLLPDGSRGELWYFEGAAGDCVQISMRGESIDALLVLHYSAPLEEFIAVDDDSLGATGAQIVKRLPENGAYYIIATTAGGQERYGNYWIDLRRTERC